MQKTRKRPCMAKNFVTKTGHRVGKAKEIFDNLPVLNAETTPQRAPHSNTEIPLSVLLLSKSLVIVLIALCTNYAALM